MDSAWPPPIDHGFSIYLDVTIALPDTSKTPEATTLELVTVRRVIRAKCDAGIPFYTKDLFQDLYSSWSSQAR